MVWYKKTWQKGGTEEETGIILAVILLILVLGFLYTRLMDFLSSQPALFSRLLDPIVDFFLSVLPYIKLVAMALSLTFITGFIYSIRGFNKITAQEKLKLNPEPKVLSTKEVVNERWNRIEDHINSDNPSDWKLAILEADIILDEMLDKMGYPGDSVSEKLKRIEKSDFTNLENAWEAHKIRNMIAHEGSEFAINEREAKRVISLYRSVFEEFKYI